MISLEQWNSLTYLRASDFDFPDQLEWEAVSNLDTAASIIGTKPLVLSDFRPDERLASQHRHGRAIDTTWPNQSPVHVWNVLRGMKRFTGLGVYVNEKGVASFHTDMRPDRAPDDPALWGGNITRQAEYEGGPLVRDTKYVTAAEILDILKKKAPVVLTIAAAALLALWWWTTRRQP